MSHLLAAILAALLLAACAQPQAFKQGAEVAPPDGCMEQRTRGGDC